jgi:tetratricopeptide (TPR) repeat protein
MAPRRGFVASSAAAGRAGTGARGRSSVALAVSLAVATLTAVPAAALEPTSFSNIRFDTGGMWTIAQPGPEMVLRLSSRAGVAANPRLTITPSTPFPGTLEEGRAATWQATLAGRATRGDSFSTEAREVPGDGLEIEIGAMVAPTGGLYLAVVQSGSFLTHLTLSAETDFDYQMGLLFLGPLLASLEVVHEAPPLVTGAPGPTGPSGPSDSFDWDGPDVRALGIYDHNCLPYEDELNEQLRLGAGFIGVVQPREVGWPAALATARKVLADPNARAQYDLANRVAKAGSTATDSAGAAVRLMMGDPFGALAQLLAGVERAPDDPDVLFNFAAILGQVGMPNESLAVLGRLRSLGKQPDLAQGTNPEAAVSYLTGYNEMLRGRLGEAKSAFSRTIALDPFLNEASRSLSLVEAHEGAGDQAKQTYLDGMWRFKPKEIIFCGADSDDVRPPVDDTFDTSQGVSGKLVDFWYPGNADDLEKFSQAIQEVLEERLDIATAHMDRAISLSDVVDFATDAPPYDVWAAKMSLLIESLDENEPVVLELQASKEAAEERMGEVAGAATARVLKRLIDPAGPPACREWRSLVNGAIGQISPAAKQLEMAQRRYAAVWYRIATGLNAQVGDPSWHEYNDRSIRAQLEGLNGEMLGVIRAPYLVLPWGGECPEEDPQDDSLAGQSGPQGPDCAQMTGGLSLEFSFELPSGGKVGVSADCDKLGLSVEQNIAGASGALAEFGLGGFAELEISRKGGYTIFAGAKGSASAGGMGGSVKSGLYISGRSNGEVTEIGGKVSVGTSAGAAGPSISKSVDDMTFNLLPTPPRPARGPSLGTFR